MARITSDLCVQDFDVGRGKVLAEVLSLDTLVSPGMISSACHSALLRPPLPLCRFTPTRQALEQPAAAATAVDTGPGGVGPRQPTGTGTETYTDHGGVTATEAATEKDTERGGMAARLQVTVVDAVNFLR